jgi:Zn ribbon nucleic-acid-binding protein
MELTVAECAKCGTEISFASEQEFEKLVNEHEHTYRW